jgi:tetrahydromethanopterin S-methyltransferase subunit B
VDYQTAESQAVELQNHANQVGEELKDLAGKLQSKISDPSLAKDLTLDLREAALAIQQQNQACLNLIQQMAEYIHVLESHVNQIQQAPQPSSFQTRGWAQQPYYGRSGGFMGNVMSGLGMGAGFGLASDLVGSIFNAF